jgi:hypothetical protein
MMSCSHWGFIEVPASTLLQCMLHRIIPMPWIEYFD